MTLCLAEIFPKDAIADAAYGRYNEYEELWDAFWYMQEKLSDVLGLFYSVIQDFQEPNRRACDICQTVNDTNEYGQLPYFCCNQECQEQRAFWGYTEEIKRPGRYINNCAKGNSDKIILARARSNWFKAHMKSTFGTASLFDLPEEARLSCLMSMTLERMAIEQRSEHDKRIAAPVNGNNEVAAKPQDHNRAGEFNRRLVPATEQINC